MHTTEKNWPDRQSVHLAEYDYCQPGGYYLTIYTEGSRHFFGTIKQGTMHLNRTGLIAQEEWNKLPQRFLGVSLDEFVFMPNHMHGVIIITDVVRRVVKLPDLTRVPERFHRSMLEQAVQKQSRQKPLPLWEIIRSFKAATACIVRKQVNRHFGWQAKTYTCILPGERNLFNVREYMRDNPVNWEKDVLYTSE